MQSTVLVDVAPNLWLWRTPHPRWQAGQGWDPLVSCTVVQSATEVALIDPLLPPPEAHLVWDRLAQNPPTMAVILKPDHVRDVDAVVERFQVRAYGPRLFWPDDVPRTALLPLDPGMTLPGNLHTLYEGRGRLETPLWLPDHRALIFADALTAPHGQLLVWDTPWHHERTLPALRHLLALPFEMVLVSHGSPVHSREAYEQALELPPWAG